MLPIISAIKQLPRRLEVLAVVALVLRIVCARFFLRRQRRPEGTR